MHERWKEHLQLFLEDTPDDPGLLTMPFKAPTLTRKLLASPGAS